MSTQSNQNSGDSRATEKNILIGILLLVIVIGAVALWQKKSDPILVTKDETKHVDADDGDSNEPIESVETTKEFKTSGGLKFDQPNDWVLRPAGYSVPKIREGYHIDIPNGDSQGVNFSVINLTEWAKGPTEDEVPALPHKERAIALGILKNIYDHQTITPQDRTAFEKQAGEFLGYSESYRVDLKYIATPKNDFRGITFYSTMGQDVGVWPVYYAVLLNSEKNIALFVTYGLYEKSPEVKQINAKYDYSADSAELEKMDKVLHLEFKDLVEKNSRNKFSFGSELNAIEQFLKSVRF